MFCQRPSLHYQRGSLLVGVDRERGASDPVRWDLARLDDATLAAAPRPCQTALVHCRKEVSRCGFGVAAAETSARGRGV